jgi:hypothetical protein
MQVSLNYFYKNKISLEFFFSRQFLRSVKCLEKHLIDLIPSKYGSTCSIDQAYYYFYGDLAARLQLAINLCEIK